MTDVTIEHYAGTSENIQVDVPIFAGSSMNLDGAAGRLLIFKKGPPASSKAELSFPAESVTLVGSTGAKVMFAIAKGATAGLRAMSYGYQVTLETTAERKVVAEGTFQVRGTVSP